ncbi:NAD(P)-dependent oxidoreductase [Campylobacterota bacterium]|nr:NAD(P)-dependent oxidoreductase [Campylobacterota bacterium]
MRILLTGWNGQLGWELHERLKGCFEVIAAGREDMDIQNPAEMCDILRRLPELSLIVNCAAFTDVDRAEREPRRTERINAGGPAILASEADKRGIPMIHFSTDYVFDGSRAAHGRFSGKRQSGKHIKPYTEEDRPDPLSVYGRSKLAGERRVRELCEKHLIFRLSGLYGTRRGNFLTTMLKYALSGETPRVVDDQIISPNWCPMIAGAAEHVIHRILSGRKTEWGIYHLTGTGGTTWHEFARLIFEKTSLLWDKPLVIPETVSSREYGALAGRPAYSVMNPDKFVNTFGYSPPDWKTQFLHCMGTISKEYTVGRHGRQASPSSSPRIR